MEKQRNIVERGMEKRRYEEIKKINVTRKGKRKCLRIQSFVFSLTRCCFCVVE